MFTSGIWKIILLGVPINTSIRLYCVVIKRDSRMCTWLWLSIHDVSQNCTTSDLWVFVGFVFIGWLCAQSGIHYNGCIQDWWQKSLLSRLVYLNCQEADVINVINENEWRSTQNFVERKGTFSFKTRCLIKRSVFWYHCFALFDPVWSLHWRNMPFYTCCMHS